jgi:hypothetical protein
MLMFIYSCLIIPIKISIVQSRTQVLFYIQSISVYYCLLKEEMIENEFY